MDRRFFELNTQLWKSMSALSPKNENFLNTESLLPLFQYMTTIPVIQNILLKNKYDKSNLKWEIKVLSNLILKHCEEKDLQKLTALYKYLTEKYHMWLFAWHSR